MIGTKKYKHSLVIGKFLPVHNGHIGLIDHALSISDKVTVMICAESDETIPAGTRLEWLSTIYKWASNVDYYIEHYSEEDLPKTSESSYEVSKLWADHILSLQKDHLFTEFPIDIDCIVSSEPYGLYVADYLDISSESYDMNRYFHPISSTQIRENWYENWDQIPDVVKPYFQKVVVVLGTESTGKTTLAEEIQKYYGNDNVSIVREIGRDIVDDSSDFDSDLLDEILEQHQMTFEKAKNELKPFVVMDTDFHTTLSYGVYCFGKMLNVDINYYKEQQRADLYLLLSTDGVNWIQDGTRMDQKSRNELGIVLKTILTMHRIHFKELNGSHRERFEKSIIEIDKLKTIINK